MAATIRSPRLNAGYFRALRPEDARAALARAGEEAARRLLTDWAFWRREDQTPPDGDWSIWLFLGGRGAGKTRAGAEWVNAEASSGRAMRIGLIGETMQDARAVMVEGASGLMRPADPAMAPRCEPSKRRLTWASGAVAEWFSAEDPEQLRGPQFDLVWADEFAKWRRPRETFDMAQFALRLGARPRMLLTTTPRNVAALKALLDDPAVAVTRAATTANAANLPASFLERVERLYGGSRLGRQELEAELLQDDERALWRRRWIDAARVRAAGDLVRVVVAVDPPVTSGPRADACGVVVAGLGRDGDVYVLADRTVEGLSPMGWALKVRAAARDFAAARVVVETNQGGELVSELLTRVGGDALRVAPVRAGASKRARAEPVATLYEQGRVRHVGSLPMLEDEMCLFGSDAMKGSPDRVDALVWAVSDLVGAGWAEPRVRTA